MNTRSTSSSRTSPPKRSPPSPASKSPRPLSMATTSTSLPIPVPPNNAYHPSPSSLSSYRSHPYSRHPMSYPSSNETLPRIHLPAPNSGAPLKVNVDIPSSGLGINSPPWPNRDPSQLPPPPQPRLHRTLSSSARGITLPPLHSISPGASSMAPPRLASPGAAPSNIDRYPQPGPGLRPSYAAYEAERRWKEDPYGPEIRSPPLRALPGPGPGTGSYSPDRYPPTHYHPPPPITRRSRSQSTISRRSEEVELTSREIGAGQNRRMAHLMSEQKRRESINSGFAALRVALPGSIPTDSKAIILRKAVSHITHLEGLLRQAGIGFGPPSREDWVEVEGEAEEEGEEEGEDVQMEVEDRGVAKWEEGRGQGAEENR